MRKNATKPLILSTSDALATISTDLFRLNEESKPALFKVAKELSEPIGEKAVTLAESFWNEGCEEGLQRGLQRGLQKGREKERQAMINALRARLSPDALNQALDALGQGEA